MSNERGLSDEGTPLLDANQVHTSLQDSVPRTGRDPRRASYPLPLRHERPQRRLGKKQEFRHKYENVPTGDEVIVDFESSDDPYRPINWPIRKKILTTLLYGLTAFGASWSSASYAAGQDEIAAEFNTSKLISSLGTTLLILGLGIGPFLFAPLSELYGRRIAIFPAYFFSIAFVFGSAAAKDLQTIMITRFFTGVFGGGAITCSAGVLSDIWDAVDRGVVLQFYGLTVLGGPMLAQLVSGAIIHGGMGWRWTLHITGIMMSVFLALDLLVLEETYEASLLVFKAEQLRHESGNWALHANHEELEVSLRDIANKFLITPWILLVTPIMFSMGTYAAFVYGLLYLTLGALPIVFEERRGWNQVVGKLPFLALFAGLAVGAAINILNNFRFARKFHENGDRPVPEARLPPLMLGSVLFSGGLFLFGWTSAPKYHWAWPMLGCFLIGIGCLIIFQGALNYLIDTFQTYAASAVAAQTTLRTILAGVFPMLASPMFHALGTEWASTILGCVAAAMVPMPFLFFFYGKKIRSKGKYMRELSGI